jgi:hypothetical protein
VPFTPFHFGPGLLVKGLAPRHVSLIAFVATQVAVDLEPLYFIVRGAPHAHRWVHTVPVAGGIGLAVGLAVWAATRRHLANQVPEVRSDLALPAAIAGGLIGGVSHPLLDGLMHRDIHALRPFAETTWVLSPVGIAAVPWACVAAGVVGVVLWMARRGKA